MIGVRLNTGRLGQLLADRLATGAKVYASPAAAISDGQSVGQGTQKAVSPQADSTTGRVAPSVPGGLQMTGSVIVTESQPVLVTKEQLRR